jgi:hypothetical protein
MTSLSHFAFPRRPFDDPSDRKDDDFQRRGTVAWTDDLGNKLETFIGTVDFTKEESDTVIIHCVGSGQYAHLEIVHANLEAMSSVTQCPVVVFDYPGFGHYRHQSTEQRTSSCLDQCCRMLSGQSKYDPYVNENNVYRCAEHVYCHVRDVMYPGKKIMLWGRSLGAAVACHLVAKYQDVDRLLLQSPLCSAFRTLFTTIPPGLEACDSFSTIDTISTTFIEHWPATLIVHSHQDEVIKMKDVKIMCSLLNCGDQGCAILVEREGLKHNDMHLNHYVKELREFLRQPEQGCRHIHPCL